MSVMVEVETGTRAPTTITGPHCTTTRRGEGKKSIIPQIN